MPVGTLPPWKRVLAVVAHPDDESFGLGALLDAFGRAGAEVHVLCLTRGEASTLGDVPGDLAAVRDAELRSAAAALGITHASLCGHPDGGLAEVPDSVVRADVAGEVERVQPDGLVVFDPVAGVTGHADHAAASVAAVAVGESLGVPVLGWALPEVVAATLREEAGGGSGGDPRGGPPGGAPAPPRQLEAVRCHATQAVPGSVLWRRLELLGDREFGRALV